MCTQIGQGKPNGQKIWPAWLAMVLIMLGHSFTVATMDTSEQLDADLGPDYFLCKLCQLN